MRTAKIFPRVGLLAVALVWGYTFVTVKESLAGIDVFPFLFYRFTIGFLLLLVIFRAQLRHAVASDWYKGILIGATLFGGFVFQTWGLRYTTATNSGFITGLAVVLVPLIGFSFFRQKIRLIHWFGAFLSAVGLALIIFPRTASVVFNVGDLITFATAVFFAFEIILISHYARKDNYVPILVGQIGITAALSAVGSFLAGGLVPPTSPIAWKGIIITGVFATAGALWGQNRFQAEVPATEAAIIYTMEPVFAALFGSLLLHERLSELQLGGALLVVAAMIAAQWPVKSAPLRTDVP